MPKTRIERLWLLGGLFVAFLMVLVGYLMFVSPQNSSTSSAQAQVSAADARNLRLQSRIDALRAQSKNLAKYQSDTQIAQLALPSTSGLPDFLRTLQAIGNATLTTVSSLTVGAPADVTGVAGAAAPSASASTSASGGQGLHVYALPITAQVAGSVPALDQFLNQLQAVQPRAVLISQLTESTGSVNGAVSGPTVGTTLQLTMQAFVAPSSAAERAQLSAASGK